MVIIQVLEEQIQKWRELEAKFLSAAFDTAMTAAKEIIQANRMTIDCQELRIKELEKELAAERETVKLLADDRDAERALRYKAEGKTPLGDPLPTTEQPHAKS